MKITDIPQTTKLNIMVSFNDKEHHLSATVLSKYQDGLLITPLRIEDTTIDFCNNAVFEYNDTITNQKHIFHLDFINRICFSESEFHIIKGLDLDDCVNRKAKRYNVQLRGIARLVTKQTLNIFVNDISLRGISFMTGSNTDNIHVGDFLEISFFKYNAYKRITVNCKVVRSFTVNNFTAFGCELYDISPELTLFIQEKISEKSNIIELHQRAQ